MTRALTLLAVLTLATGCVTPYGEGEKALSQGRYRQAATYFTEALAEDPGRSDALLGLGRAQYKQGEFPVAADTLARAVDDRPQDPTSRLYLGLSYLQQGDAPKAEKQLKTLRALSIDPRLGQQIDRALEVLRAEPLSEPTRAFVAGSLETEAELSREAREAQLEALRSFYYPPLFFFGPSLYYGPPFYSGPYPCVLARRGGYFDCI